MIQNIVYGEKLIPLKPDLAPAIFFVLRCLEIGSP